MKFNINDEQKEIIKNLYLKEGLSCTKIAKQFKTTAATISSFLKRNGIEVINKQNFFRIKEKSKKFYKKLYPL